jgi:hypothetical protein
MDATGELVECFLPTTFNAPEQRGRLLRKVANQGYLKMTGTLPFGHLDSKPKLNAHGTDHHVVSKL